MFNIKSMAMKLPSGQTPQTPPASPVNRTPAQPGTEPSPGREALATSARQQLDQLRLTNREATLARVAEIINRQRGGVELLLELKGKSLLTQATIGNTDLNTGDWVKVMRAGNELQLLGKLAPPPEAGIARALAQRMPWQQTLDGGLTKLLTALTQGLRAESAPGQLPSARSLQPLPEAARQAIEQVLTRLPASQALKPGAGSQPDMASQVKQWLSESGLFAEARLASSPSPALPDLKLAIGRVITALLAQQGTPTEQFNRLIPLASPELVQAPLQFPRAVAPTPGAGTSESATAGQVLRLLAGMLNRITVNQLHSQVLTARAGGDAAAPASTMLLELPWVSPQNEPRVAQLRLEQYREGGSSESGNRHQSATREWRLALAIDLDEAGPLHFDVALRQQSVSARVWAEKQSTLKRVHDELPLLRRSLTDLGLDVTDLDCRRGTPQQPATRLEHRLVDTRA